MLMAVLCFLCPNPKDVPTQLETPRNPPSMFRSFLQSYLYGNVRPRWPTKQLLQTKWLEHPFLERSDSLTNNSPLLDAARRFLTERVTTQSPEPLLAPSVSGQESKEEQAEKENVKAKPEGMKSILKSSPMAAVAAAPQSEEISFPDTEMPSTSTGKGDTQKKSIPKEITYRPPKLLPLTRRFLDDLKSHVSEGNPTKKYTVQQIIGQGTFGTVFRGVDIATGRRVAIKKIFVLDRKNKRELVLTEVAVLKRMRHPNIIRYIDSYLFNEELWLVTEYVEGCTLGDVISKQALEEEMIASISREPKHKPPELETPRNLSPVFRSFLQSCLKRKVKRRWTARKLMKD
ncbi:serine/threonine-protein kinase PAK 3-like [Pseudopipra pipra]|uniref:serine/threonine-protein kinase PAK 3-like n=1 Tax=Pseudopipra pipra TaxID=415032 RepID=UPI003138DD3A